MATKVVKVRIRIRIKIKIKFQDDITKIYDVTAAPIQAIDLKGDDSESNSSRD